MTCHPRDAARSRRCRGFSLVEVLTAAVIVGIALAAVSWSIASAAQARSALAEEPVAFLLAREVRELAESLPRTPSGGSPATRASEVLALDSLDGAQFSPPLRADMTADASLSGWTQATSLSVCTLANPSVATFEDPAAGLDESAERVYRLTVAVLHDGRLVDRIHWWLTP
jgi:prepilin-type N-terminal cleavage/methylation domain-containing protein